MSNIRAARLDRERVATCIQQRRIELGMTQEQLAKASDVALRTVQNAESGDHVVAPLTRGRLEQALGLPMGYLSKLYVGEEVESPDGQVGGLGPDIEKILDHPHLSPQMREVIFEQLNRVHEDFAKRTAEFFGLGDSAQRDGGR